MTGRAAAAQETAKLFQNRRIETRGEKGRAAEEPAAVGRARPGACSCAGGGPQTARRSSYAGAGSGPLGDEMEAVCVWVTG